MPDTLPTITRLRLCIETRSYDEATDWRRTWNETQTPETLHSVAVNRTDGGLEFVCSTISQFEVVSGFIRRMHPRG